MNRKRLLKVITKTRIDPVSLKLPTSIKINQSMIFYCEVNKDKRVTRRARHQANIEGSIR